jgi:hypothetical protein
MAPNRWPRHARWSGDFVGILDGAAENEKPRQPFRRPGLWGQNLDDAAYIAHFCCASMALPDEIPIGSTTLFISLPPVR